MLRNDEIELFDPTGAGDSLAGGLVGYISKHGEESKHTRKAILSYNNMWYLFLLWRILYVLQNRSANME